jgi:hypothetical protein
MKRFVWMLCLLTPALLGGLSVAQTVSSSVSGVLLDPTGSAIANAVCKLVNQGTGASLEASSGPDGRFVFPTVQAGTYTLRAEAPGFKALELKDAAVTSQENRTLGNLTMQVGEVRESVSVTAEAAALQLASAERSGLVTGTQLNDLALKGRDFFALMQTIPGVVDTRASREATTNGSNAGIFINGARDNQKAFTVDGMVDHDTHSNGSMAFLPNMDAIGEVRILTSNYQAEYGRNSGGAITAITKSGTTQFHGSGYNFYRHESLNANNFFNNRSGTPKQPYRYRISGYSIGGPIYIPKRFNTDKSKLFFFWSQEYTGVKTDFGTRFANTPTELERNGDFSRSDDVNGSLIVITDPTTGRPFPGNVIPRNRIHGLGQSILNFYPLPNFTDPDPRNLYRWNLRSVYSGGTPRRNDILRVDANLTPSLRLYYRYGHDRDNYLIPWGQFPAGPVNYLLSPTYQDRYGSGNLFHVTKTFSPTLVYEAILGTSMVFRDYDFEDPSKLQRSLMDNPQQWYADPNVEVDYIPDVIFGGQPANPINAGVPLRIPNRYRNPVYTLTQAVSKVSGRHSFKAGISIERTNVEFYLGGNYRGQFNFSRDLNNPFDSGHSYSNALLGNFSSYTEAQRRLDAVQRFWNAEWYIQDNWKVTRRLTFDLGVRLYHMPPIREINHTMAGFDPALYDPAKAPALFEPARDASGRRVSRNPITGQLDVAPLIGQYVPGTGDPANGTFVGGVDGFPPGLYTRPGISFGPRFGFAYDLAGDGKTAIRGGWGWFHDTGQNNPVSATAGNPPVSYAPVLYYGNLDSYAQGGGAIGPSNLTTMFGPQKLPNTMNFSVGIQRQLGGLVVDASYVGALSRHLFLRTNLNPVAMHARFDPRNEDPTQPGRPLPDNFFRPYRGFGDIYQYQTSGTSNYNSLQVGVNRRFTRGLQFGLAYTWSRALGVASADGTIVSAYFDVRSRDYGPLNHHRLHTMVFNYTYELPKVGGRLGFRPAGWVLDNWVVSGITSFISGAPFTPGFSTVDAADLTGSSEGARITVVGDATLPKSERTFFRNFNTEAFQRTPRGGFGNAGVNMLYGPGINNWDITVSKRVPLYSESRYIQFRTELFNAWNHTQFSGLFTTARFDAQGRQVDPNFGAYSDARTPRIIQLSLKVVF